MKPISRAFGGALSLVAATGLVLAQDNAPPPTDQQYPSTNQNGGWRRMSGPPQGTYPSQGAPNAPVNGGAANAAPQQGFPVNEPPPAIPSQLTIPPGTFVTVRLSQGLSSDHNQQGDPFSATLVKPVVVDGMVVADRGQTIAGQVTEAQKAGHVQGTSRLGIQLTEMTLVDGSQIPIRSQFVTRNGSTSVGRDAAAIGTTTGLGAAIGAAADLGRGAAIGAGIGAAAGVAGVLLTRGNPTVLYPEQVLTFRIDEPVTVSTARAPQAFRYVGPGDYDQPQDQPRLQARPAPPPPPPPYYGPYPYYYAGPYYGPYYYGYPYYWAPGFSVGVRVGPGYHRRWR